MRAPALPLYILLLSLLHSLLAPIHLASLQAIACLVFALLACQSLHPADLCRGFPCLLSARSRQGFKRVRRALHRPQLGSAWLTPLLVRAGLRLLGQGQVRVVLDSSRCRRWEVFTLGLVLSGRVLPVAWSVLAYPWPKKSFTPAVLALLERLLSCWPSERPLHLLADRGFPSLKLFCLLERHAKHLPLGYSVRLRASDYVRLEDGQATSVGSLEAGLTVGEWHSLAASYQQRGKTGPKTLLVIGRGEPCYPAHQMGPSDCARREERARRRLVHLQSKKQAQTLYTDRAWALLTTEQTPASAASQYRLRFSTEGTYRDLKSWDLEAVVGQEQDRQALDGLLGLAALGYFVQVALGWKAGRTQQLGARARQSQWTTTDRISLFWRGRQVLHDPAWDWTDWLDTTLHELTQDLLASSQTYQCECQPLRIAA